MLSGAMIFAFQASAAVAMADLFAQESARVCPVCRVCGSVGCNVSTSLPKWCKSDAVAPTPGCDQIGHMERKKGHEPWLRKAFGQLAGSGVLNL